MISFEDFRLQKLKVREKKVSKINNSYGTKEAWRWLKKNKWLDLEQAITEREFGVIVKTINSYLVSQLFNGHTVTLPHGMGRLELTKYQTTVKLQGDKLITNKPINWVKTLELWHEDKNALANRTLVRQECKELFKIVYNKRYANYPNKIFYKFHAPRSMRRQLSEKIKDNQTDAILIDNYAVH